MNESLDGEPPVGNEVTAGVQMYLRETKPWVQLTAILTFVMVGFMVLVAFVLAAVGFVGVGNGGGAAGAIFGVFGAMLYMVMAVVYLFPGLFLYRYGTAIGRVLQDRSSASLEEALKHQRSFWRFVGVLMLVGVVIAILGVAAAILIPAFIRASGHSLPM